MCFFLNIKLCFICVQQKELTIRCRTKAFWKLCIARPISSFPARKKSNKPSNECLKITNDLLFWYILRHWKPFILYCEWVLLFTFVFVSNEKEFYCPPIRYVTKNAWVKIIIRHSIVWINFICFFHVQKMWSYTVYLYVIIVQIQIENFDGKLQQKHKNINKKNFK